MLQSVRNFFCRPHNDLSVSNKLVAHAAREYENAGYNLADYKLCVSEQREIFDGEVLKSLQRQFCDRETIHTLLRARKDLGSSTLAPDDRKFLREHLHVLRPVDRRARQETAHKRPRRDKATGPDGQEAPTTGRSQSLPPSLEKTIST